VVFFALCSLDRKWVALPNLFVLLYLVKRGMINKKLVGIVEK